MMTWDGLMDYRNTEVLLRESYGDREIRVVTPPLREAGLQHEVYHESDYFTHYCVKAKRLRFGLPKRGKLAVWDADYAEWSLRSFLGYLVPFKAGVHWLIVCPPEPEEAAMIKPVEDASADSQD